MGTDDAATEEPVHGSGAADTPGQGTETAPQPPQPADYPREADPDNPDAAEPAEVTGTPTDPLDRELHVDNTRPEDDGR